MMAIAGNLEDGEGLVRGKETQPSPRPIASASLAPRICHLTIRFGSTANVLAKRMLKY